MTKKDDTQMQKSESKTEKNYLKKLNESKTNNSQATNIEYPASRLISPVAWRGVLFLKINNSKYQK